MNSSRERSRPIIFASTRPKWWDAIAFRMTRLGLGDFVLYRSGYSYFWFERQPYGFSVDAFGYRFRWWRPHYGRTRTALFKSVPRWPWYIEVPATFALAFALVFALGLIGLART